MKVLHIINDLSRNGGAQRFVIDLIQAPPEGVEIKVITLDDTNDFADELQASGVQCYAWGQLGVLQKWRILRWPNLVHGHLFPSVYLALAAIGKKRIQTEHATHNRRRDHAWLKPFEFFMYGRYQRTVCITEHVKEALEGFLPFWKSHYCVILNGIDIKKFSGKEKKCPQAQETVHIGMVGRFHRYKDHPTLIRALALLPKRYQLHLIGDGERREEYHLLVHQLDLENRVTFHGVCSEIPAILDSLHLYVQSSTVEGFGLAPLEAMACGLPVLGSRVQGMSEVIANENALFDVGDEKGLASQIEGLFSSVNLYQNMSLYSLSRCQHFSLRAFREQYYQTYEKVINEALP